MTEARLLLSLIGMIAATSAYAGGEAYLPTQEQIDDAKCYCSRQLVNGIAPGGFFCTGGLRPMLLREYKEDPCKMGWSDIKGSRP